MDARPGHQAATKELRTFGLLVGTIFGIIGVWPLLLRGEVPRWWAVTIAALLLGIGVVFPRALGPVHRLWMKVGHVLGWVNTRIILGVIFYGLFTPMGLIRRALGKDSVRRAFEQGAETYRERRTPRPPSHVKHQF